MFSPKITQKKGGKQTGDRNKRDATATPSGDPISVDLSIFPPSIRFSSQPLLCCCFSSDLSLQLILGFRAYRRQISRTTAGSKDEAERSVDLELNLSRTIGNSAPLINLLIRGKRGRLIWANKVAYEGATRILIALYSPDWICPCFVGVSMTGENSLLKVFSLAHRALFVEDTRKEDCVEVSVRSTRPL
ncbi:hypothetical protein Cgig2_017542 [Carnegiea gigantea]|uniref:Uncharacterized protein n=1 Tax=Carnegiea gigantea TaxID=171969 RepID=A0A9Q1QMZ8_9CARY|nr:hypothetical protein Cgig2_017542 [Carnegiea gigantea]